MEILTLEKLKAMKPGEVFAQGEVENSPDGVYMTDEHKGQMLKWVAKRGGYHDWAIYLDWAYKSFDSVLSNGQKTTTATYIKKLVPCDDEAFNMYRY
jgi:hypothetical protein